MMLNPPVKSTRRHQRIAAADRAKPVIVTARTNSYGPLANWGGLRLQ